MGGKIFDFINKHISHISKIILTGYLCYWVYIIWQFDLNKTTYPLELFLLLSIQISFTISILIYIYFRWFKNEKSERFNRNILIGLTVFTIIIFPVTYGILIFGRNLSEFEGVKIGTADGWLAFIGSIIGGLVTMIAVVITINNERKIRNSENSRQLERHKNELRPIIDFTFVHDEKNEIFQEYPTFLISEISNESNSHAIIQEIKIFENVYELKNGDYKLMFKEDSSSEMQIYSFSDQILAGRTSKELLFSIPVDFEVMEYLSKSLDTLFIKIILNITFTDIQNLQKYKLFSIRKIGVNATKVDDGHKILFSLEMLKVNDTYLIPDIDNHR